MTVEQETIEDPQEPTPTVAEQMAADLLEATADQGSPVEPEGIEPEAGTGEPTEPEAPQPPQSKSIGGIDIPPEQEEAVAGLISWANGLTDEQSAAVARIMAGETPKPPEAPAPPPAEPVDPIKAIEVDYPDVAAVFRAQQEELTRLQAELPRIEKIEQVTAAEVARNTQQAAFDTEAKVKAEFLDANGLTDEDYTALVDAPQTQALVKPMVESLGVEEGFRRVLAVALNSDPERMQKVIDKAVAEAATSGRIANKQAKAAGLSPQGGSAPKTTAAGQVGLPVDQRKAAMAEEIREILGN